MNRSKADVDAADARDRALGPGPLRPRDAAMLMGDRLIGIFERGEDGRRPLYGDHQLFQQDPHFKDHLLFYEYFHGDTGEGLGASHQTGWTALVGDLALRQDRLRKGGQGEG